MKQAAWTSSPVAPSLPGTFPGRSPWRRFLVRAQARRLDRQLADGANPGGSAMLALRAHELTSRRSRQRIAASIDCILELPEHPGRFSAAVRPSGSSVASARSQLQAISELLRAPEPVYARGVALTNVLVHDGLSPLYDPAGAAGTREWTQRAIDALDGRA